MNKAGVLAIGARLCRASSVFVFGLTACASRTPAPVHASRTPAQHCDLLPQVKKDNVPGVKEQLARGCDPNVSVAGERGPLL